MYSNTQMYDAMDARLRAASRFRLDPNINLVDVGWRIKEKQGRRIQRELTVRVHVSQKLDGVAFEAFKEAQPRSVISEENIGFPCDVITCSYKLHGFLGNAGPMVSFPSPAPVTVPVTAPVTVLSPRAIRPLRGGIGISRPGPNFGTLGGLVKDRQTGQPMILSNFHVLAGSGVAQPGQRVFQPPQAEGGSPVARLTRHAMGDGYDAAVAALDAGVTFRNEQVEIGSVTGLTEPVLDMVVTKSGRRTGVTEGIIDGVGGIRVMPYAGFDFFQTIREIAHIAPLNTDNVSAGGDSGSWWLERSTRRAVALHFAGSDNPDFALAISMPKVLDALRVTLAP